MCKYRLGQGAAPFNFNIALEHHYHTASHRSVSIRRLSDPGSVDGAEIFGWQHVNLYYQCPHIMDGMLQRESTNVHYQYESIWQRNGEIRSRPCRPLQKRKQGPFSPLCLVNDSLSFRGMALLGHEDGALMTKDLTSISKGVYDGERRRWSSSILGASDGHLFRCHVCN